MTIDQGGDVLNNDPDYCDFVASISVTDKELAALVSMPELKSVEQAREYVRKSTARHDAPRGKMRREMDRLAGHLRSLADMFSTISVRHGRNQRH